MFQLPPLPYPYGALEPYIDAQTMEIHYTKHHQGYVDKLNAVLNEYPDIQEKSIEELLTNLNEVPESIRIQVKNQGGGHYNHSLFWKMMGPDKNSPSGNMLSIINDNFGSFDEFKKKFAETAANHFGSGWAWLVKDNTGKLILRATPNQDSPISEGQKPILGLDVWEHAYYLKYQNRRTEYIEAWWNIVNWQAVEQNMA